MPPPPAVPVHIERLAKQIRQIDEEHERLRERVVRTRDEALADRLRQRMADLKNQRVVPAGELEEWLKMLPPERQVEIEAFLSIHVRGHQP